MNNDTIKISIKGFINNETKTVFTYPSQPTSPAADKWLAGIGDPNDARWFDEPRIYAFWKNTTGNYYALIVPAAEGGRLMLTLFTGNKCISMGQAAVSALNELATTLLPDYNNTEGHAHVDAVLKALKGYLVTDNAPATAPAVGIQTLKGYRYYNNDNELAHIMEFTQQVEYRTLAVVYAMPQPAEPVTINDPTYKLLTTPVRASYCLEPLPAGVKTNKSTFINNDTLVITYTRPGFASEQVSLSVNGKNTAFVTYRGMAIRIKSAEDAGIKWRRGVKVKCVDDRGNNIPAFSYNANGRTVNYSEKSGIVFDGDTTEYKVTISAHGYETQEVVFTEAQMESRSHIVVTLNAPAAHVKLTIYDRTGRPVSGTVTVKDTDPLYRLLTTNKELSVGHVKPEPISAPLTSPFDKKNDKAENKKEPKTRGGNDKTAGTKPAKKSPYGDIDFAGDKPSKPAGPDYSSIIKAGIGVGAVVIAYLLVSTLVHFMSNESSFWPYSPTQEDVVITDGDNNTSDEVVDGSDVIATIEPTTTEQPETTQVAQPEPEPVQSAEPNPAADKQYLTSNQVWDKNRLTSPEWQNFFNDIQAGNAAALNRAERLPGNATWKVIVFTQGGHRDKTEQIGAAMREMSASGTLDVDALFDKVKAICNSSASNPSKKGEAKSASTSTAKPAAEKPASKPATKSTTKSSTSKSSTAKSSTTKSSTDKPSSKSTSKTGSSTSKTSTKSTESSTSSSTGSSSKSSSSSSKSSSSKSSTKSETSSTKSSTSTGSTSGEGN